VPNLHAQVRIDYVLGIKEKAELPSSIVATNHDGIFLR
jgi:hypothetical protein